MYIALGSECPLVRARFYVSKLLYDKRPSAGNLMEIYNNYPAIKIQDGAACLPDECKPNSEVLAIHRFLFRL